MQNVSILSKKFKSKEWKEIKKIKHENNQKLRADLQSQKANAASVGKRDEIQKQIDAISKRGN